MKRIIYFIPLLLFIPYLKPKKVVEKKLTPTEQYIDRFKKVAVYEHKKFGIPASVTLAQGILESRSGQSDLTKKTNNHFGIKCFNGCNYKNSKRFADDKPTDRFKVYESNWYSFRDHSQFLMGKRYKRCRECGDDWKCWVRNLKRCGYATSNTYTKNLTSIIKKYKLYQYDNIYKDIKTL
jgi:flagellum-specific peptidoglycan hydrolase FlgJ